jgi:hypothetical protein
MVLGGLCLAFSLLTLFVWIPLDVTGGMFESARGQTHVGDAMAPTVIAVGMALMSVLFIVGAWMSSRAGKTSAQDSGRVTFANLRFLLCLAFVLASGMALMVYCGPWAVAVAKLFGAQVTDYRALRDELPWKYIGFVVGGFWLSVGLMAFIKHTLRWQDAAIALLVVVAIALAIDLPFDNLLLPPNADQ